MTGLLRSGVGAALLASTAVVARAEGLPLNLEAANAVQGDVATYGGYAWETYSFPGMYQWGEAGARGRANVPLGLGWNFEIEAATDLNIYGGFNDAQTALVAHLYGRAPGSHAFGVFGGYTTPLSVGIYIVGAEAQAHLGNAIIYGQATYGRGNVGCAGCTIDELQARSQLQLYFTERTSLSADAMFTRFAVSGDTFSTWTGIVTMTQQLGTTPIAVFLQGQFDHTTYSFTTDWRNVLSVRGGIRVLIGPAGTTLWSNAVTGPAMDVRFPSARLSCFIGSTGVLMADGERRPIASVRVGDVVLGEGGALNRVLEIETPLLGDRKLYGFNGGPAFVTAEHPFKTRAGWKAIDPAATLAETGHFRVGALVEGEELMVIAAVVAEALPVRAAGGRRSSAPLVDVQVETAFDALRTITAVAADPATAVYNLRLDGNNTYFANGYLVHNK